MASHGPGDKEIVLRLESQDPGLFRLRVSPGATPQRLSWSGRDSWDPAVSLSKHRLVYLSAALSKVNLDETAILSTWADRSIVALDEALTAFSQLAPRHALFRRIDGGRNRRGSENFAKHGPARLESRAGVAPAGVEPTLHQF